MNLIKYTYTLKCCKQPILKTSAHSLASKCLNFRPGKPVEGSVGRSTRCDSRNLLPNTIKAFEIADRARSECRAALKTFTSFSSSTPVTPINNSTPPQNVPSPFFKHPCNYVMLVFQHILCSFLFFYLTSVDALNIAGDVAQRDVTSDRGSTSIADLAFRSSFFVLHQRERLLCR